MPASQHQDPFAAAGQPPGLLAWQVYFLAYCAGIWSLRHPEAALAVAGLLWAGLAAFRVRDWRRCLPTLALTLVLVAGSLGLGVLHARLVLPDVPPVSPAATDGRSKALLRGRVAEVTDKPFGRLEILLEDVRAEKAASPGASGTPASPDNSDNPANSGTVASAESAGSASPAGNADNATVAVPGRVAFDWDEPDCRPAPGQNVEALLRLWPVRGFQNPGGADFDWQQRLRGVFHRAYARGPLPDARWGERPADAWWDLREGLRASLLQRLPPSQGGAIVLGLLMGDRSRIGLAVTDELRAAGLAHTLALSGLNVVYVALLGWGLAWLIGLAWPGLFLRLPRQKLAILISFPLIAAYVWVGQASPSLVRSACMFGFWGLLLLLDRSRALIDGLFLALALMILAQPLAVFDVGLQMSALSVAGLAILLPWLRGFWPHRPGWLNRALALGWDALAMSLAANLALLPVVVSYFGVFQPNFLLNLPWVPVQGLVVQVLGMVGMALAPVPGLGNVAGWLLQAASTVQDAMLVALHHASQAGWLPVWALLRPLWPELLGAGLVTALAPYCLRRRNAAPVLLVLAGLLLMAVPQGRVLLDESRPESWPEVRLTLLDVGQSQALLVTVPGGRRVLVDGGGTASQTFDMGRSVVGPSLAWGRAPRLDAVVMSHPDLDHAQGLAFILRRFRVGRFITNGQWPTGPLGQTFDAALAAGAPRPETFAPGDRLDLGSGVWLEALHPAADFDKTTTNERSLVLRLVWNGVPLALLPGDVQRAGIEDMIDRGRDLRAMVLVLPHHGSKSSLSGMLYEAVDPVQAVVSCGYLNHFRFPNQAVVDELARRGIPLASTADRGALELVWSAPGQGVPLTFHLSGQRF